MAENRRSVRFEPLGGETTIDRWSGLVWARNAGLFDYPMTWTESIAAVEKLNRQQWAGHSDWRLPNRRELFSLIDHERINPALPKGHPFDNVFSGYYWTSTTCARLPRQAWYVHLGGARVQRGMKSGSYLVWPVRGPTAKGNGPARTGAEACWDENGQTVPCRNTGQDGEHRSGVPWPKLRFAVHRETITDRLTGLMWIQALDSAGRPVTWQGAQDSVATLNARNAFGHRDWRLPGIRELETLVDLEHHSPALPLGNPFREIREYYWSATTSAYENSYAWVLYLTDGAVGVGFKINAEFFACAVRDEQTDRIRL